VAVCGVLLVGMLIGLINGLIVTRLAITPIVATRASSAVLIGAARQASEGAWIAAPAELKAFSTQRRFSLPHSLVLAIIFIAVVALIMHRTIYGSRFEALGGNPTTSVSTGISAEMY
jgi:ribose transport system permease protein